MIKQRKRNQKVSQAKIPWILQDRLLNKDTAFTLEERKFLRIEGFIPYHVMTLPEQVHQQYQNFKNQTSDISKYLFLSHLYNRNEVLFFKLVSDHINEMLPFIYTPTVGQASLNFSLLYTTPRGLYLAYPDQDRISNIIRNYPADEIDVVVVTDGERILGLGDLGVGGMAIPIGKLCLYTIFGGIHPARTLPIILDVGTNNETLLKDPLYLGWKHVRIKGKKYEAFVQKFIQALKKRYPKVLLQWEDFGRDHAQPLLDQYRQKICSFNDDIQGTAAVVLSAVLAAIKKNRSELHEQRIIIFGGGSAGMGICHYLMGAMMAKGISQGKALKALYVLDIQGLVHTGMKTIPSHQKLFARRKEEIQSWKVVNTSLISLEEVVKEVRPTVLIGVSTVGGAFTETIVTDMARYVENPIIFPLSNPTSKCEAHPSDLIKWTKGKAIIATGSPYDPIFYEGKKFNIAQCNNVYVFPGIGLGAICCRPQSISETMFYKAAEILSNYAPTLHLPQDELFPSFEKLPAISKEIAVEVVKVAQAEGLSSLIDESQIEKTVDSIQWIPEYLNYTKERISS